MRDVGNEDLTEDSVRLKIIERDLREKILRFLKILKNKPLNLRVFRNDRPFILMKIILESEIAYHGN